MKLFPKKIWGPKNCLWPINSHAKRANLILLWHPTEVHGKTNKLYYSKELEQGFSVLLFSFGTALAIEKIGFESFPSYPYWVQYKADTSHYRVLAGIQFLEIPTAKIQISNGRHACYRYPPEPKPSAK
jgi:hypothetical protein